MQTMLKSIESTLQNEGVKKTEILYVAVSGGADSVALLHLLNHLGYTCHVLHLNHLLRGDESEKDQQFVETLAHTLQLPITTQQTDVSALASSHSISIEMAGRKARHELFRSLPTGPIALGHHADDQVETFLLRLMRGAGRSGLSGMQPLQIINGLTLVRPLLHLHKEQLTEWLKQHELTWREDASNANPAFQRNQLRHQILPLLKNELNPNLVETLLRTMNVFRDEDVWLDQTTMKYEATNIATAPPFLQRRWIRHWLYEQQIPELSFDVCEQIIEALNQPDGSRRCDIDHQYQIEIAYGIPRLVERKVAPTSPSWTLEEATGIGWRKDHGKGPGILPATASISSDKLAQRTLHVRPIQPGDRFQPLGMKGHRKLQDILVDQKIPATQRPFIPVVCCDDEIIWVPGYCIASDWRVLAPQASALHLTLFQRAET
ncbi:MAG: tRNA lysidine(34) synthetase TilS [Kiritimatiellaceae bacterium]|jgi:tRNA(Ile)-lysidine synthase|nr:tRNA lysidine(34) synthetase TilS [Kiritimatiellaceae bacterium]